MNERIKELAEQAGHKRINDYYTNGTVTAFTDIQLQKFAKLIVQECISVVSRRAVGDHNREDAEVARCVVDIKKHFGVEDDQARRSTLEVQRMAEEARL
jgi:ribosomal protein S2